MRQLTDTEEKMINTTAYSVDWNEEFDEAYNRTQRPELIEQELEMRFDDSVEYDTVEDLGGINVYFKDNKLIAFYDYEQFVGTYF
jgi:hypothetical protein